MEVINCVICKEKFFKKIHNQKVCWKECRRILSNKLSVEKNKTPEWKLRRAISARKDYEKHKEHIKNRVRNWRPYKHNCIECWKEFYSWGKKTKFCNKKCSFKHSKITRLWEWNPAYKTWLYSWKDRKIHWYKDFQFQKTCKELDKKLLEKQGYLSCECCWVVNSIKYEHHHLVFRSEKPKHEHLHNIKNILYCCIVCHNDFHKHKSKRNKIVEDRKLNELFWNDVLNK